MPDETTETPLADEDPESPTGEKELSFAEFLESHPPNQSARIADLQVHYTDGDYRGLAAPEIQLHCSHESCNGTRFFRCVTRAPKLIEGEATYVYLTYRCWNCQRTEKIFSVGVEWDKHPRDFLPSGKAVKFGELPAFGPPTSSRLIKLIGPDRDIFLKGRRCENQGLGIGAFVYYRRVVETQKSRILNQIAKVAAKIGATPEKIKLFADAAKETQFSRAMDIAKPALPESLLIDGHNPLALLHSALSEGVHELDDETCLRIAGSIRIVLGELSDRIAQALKDEAELKGALSTLLNRK